MNLRNRTEYDTAALTTLLAEVLRRFRLRIGAERLPKELTVHVRYTRRDACVQYRGEAVVNGNVIWLRFPRPDRHDKWIHELQDDLSNGNARPEVRELYDRLLRFREEPLDSVRVAALMYHELLHVVGYKTHNSMRALEPELSDLEWATSHIVRHRSEPDEARCTWHHHPEEATNEIR